MPLPNIFTSAVSEGVIERINKLSSDSKPQWGKMNVAQMLAHCNVAYELVYQNKHKKPGFLMKLILTKLVKNKVVSEAPFPKSSRTAPEFLIVDEKDFGQERGRLINHIRQTVEHGEKYFDGKESVSFGKLTSTEWNNMFYKHLDHHLTQFGV